MTPTFAAEDTTQQIRVVGARTFVLNEDVWTDTTFDAATMRLEDVRFGSDRYFQLLQLHPDWGDALALGEKVIVVEAGEAYRIGETGESEAQDEQPTATPVASISSPAGQSWLTLLWSWLRGLAAQ